MDVPKVNSKLLGELEEMGFPFARATRALHYSVVGSKLIYGLSSTCLSLRYFAELKVSLVQVRIEIEGSKSSSMSEEVKLKAQKLRKGFGQEKSCKSQRRLQKKTKDNAVRKAEKEEEKRARERIRQKLQQDKVERRGKVGLAPESHASYKTATPMVQENKDDDIKVKRAFETLLIYIRNVARDPDEDKFRKIRLSNPAFKERVGIFKQGIKFLELCGFEQVEGGRYLFLPRARFDMAEFKSAGNELQSAITNPFFGLLSTEE
ncbi:PUB domain-containing protein [Cynara cardunculus var. scolymus]|uniref:PUB domain-containing protein n=1 Tax=Cynara cardunculus var. scolymus TaxID=59895 RepID=A0A103XP40_CYNCS|nr:PUB domain-containing protein [Cynara cardunculus var. scolymus]